VFFVPNPAACQGFCSPFPRVGLLAGLDRLRQKEYSEPLAYCEGGKHPCPIR